MELCPFLGTSYKELAPGLSASLLVHFKASSALA